MLDTVFLKKFEELLKLQFVSNWFIVVIPALHNSECITIAWYATISALCDNVPEIEITEITVKTFSQSLLHTAGNEMPHTCTW